MKPKQLAPYIAALFIGLGIPAHGAEPEGGRYKMSPVEDGFVRLDTETGAMSLCTRQTSGWSCQPMREDQKTIGDELSRLRAENAELKEENRRMEETFGLDARGSQRKNEDGSGNQDDSSRDMTDTKPEIQLPSEEQVDQAVDYLERMIRKFRERFENFGEKTKPRPTPEQNNDRQQDDSTPL